MYAHLRLHPHERQRTDLYSKYVEESFSFAFAPDGTMVVASGGHIFDAVTGDILLAFSHRQTGDSIVAYSPDRKTIAIANQGGISLALASTGIEYRYHGSEFEQISALTFSPDGNEIAVAGQFRGPRGIDERSEIQILNTENLEKKSSLGTLASVTFLAFRPGVKELMFGVAGLEIRLWDTDKDTDRAWIKNRESRDLFVAIDHDPKSPGDCWL